MNTTKLNARIAAVGLASLALATVTGPSQAADATLDRGALLKLADTYLGTLVAHDPGKVPLASSVKVVENVTSHA